MSNPKLQAPNPNHSQLPNPKPISNVAHAELCGWRVGNWFGFGSLIGSWPLGVDWDLGFGAWDLTPDHQPTRRGFLRGALCVGFALQAGGARAQTPATAGSDGRPLDVKEVDS